MKVTFLQTGFTHETKRRNVYCFGSEDVDHVDGKEGTQVFSPRNGPSDVLVLCGNSQCNKATYKSSLPGTFDVENDILYCDEPCATLEVSETLAFIFFH